MLSSASLESRIFPFLMPFVLIISLTRTVFVHSSCEISTHLTYPLPTSNNAFNDCMCVGTYIM